MDNHNNKGLGMRIAQGSLLLLAICLLLTLEGLPQLRPVPRLLSSGGEEVPGWALSWASSPHQTCKPAQDSTGIGEQRFDFPASQVIALGGQERCERAELLYQSSERLDPSAARIALNDALELALDGDDPRLLAMIVQRLQVLEASEQNARRSLELSLAEGYFWHLSGDLRAMANHRHNFATLLYRMGRLQEADRLFEELLSSMRPFSRGNRSLAAASLTIRGRIALAQEDLTKAEALLVQARDLRDPGNQKKMAATLDALCQVYIAKHRYDEAAQLSREVLAGAAGDRRGEANALATAAQIDLERGNYSSAVQLARESRSRLGPRQDPNLDLHSLFIEAAAERGLGRPQLADATMEALIGRSEDYRRFGQGPLGIPYFSVRRKYLSDWVEDLVSRGLDDRAFEVTEWARARDLLDTLVLPLNEARLFAPSDLREQELKLRDKLATLGGQWEALVLQGQLAEGERVASQMRTFRVALMRIEAEIRYLGGGFLATPLSRAQVSGLIREGEAILCYWLGERESLVWILTPQGSRWVKGLPARKTIERSARRFRELAAKGVAAERETETELEALSEALLVPLAHDLEGTKLLMIVPDGALADIPFALLRRFGGTQGRHGRPLVEEMALSSLPSLSALAAIRNRSAERLRRQSVLFAAVADPVYGGPQDPRLTDDSGSLSTSVRPRLQGTREEVDNVSSLLDSKNVRSYLDFEASRETVLGGCLEGAAFVHFGAHADFHLEDPDLSSIYLSERDRAGARINGALRLQDVSQLKMSATLVVLAGCSTALGKGYLGEGSLAMPRGFLSAGAASVIASLWKVDDRATALLVRRLWEAILVEGASPVEALQSAQLELAVSKEWAHPFYWGGFVLLGDPQVP